LTVVVQIDSQLFNVTNNKEEQLIDIEAWLVVDGISASNTQLIPYCQGNGLASRVYSMKTEIPIVYCSGLLKSQNGQAGLEID